MKLVTQSELGKPFPQETELAEKMTGDKDRPSVLADLKEKSAYIQPSNKKNNRDEMTL